MYPLKFQPIFQRRLWGGQRLRQLLQKPIEAGAPIGESWELADLPAGTVKADSTGAAADGSFSNVITNGPWLGGRLHEVLGEIGAGGGVGGGHFPLLVKFLDAQQDLSVQVHPDAAYCRSHAGAHLKSEAWYILHAEPGARIYKGVKPGTTQEQFRAALDAGKVEPLLNVIKVQTGDCHYLPSGTVHALGAGIVVAEVQTPSDTTFRVFDWNRLTPEGKPRQLHVEEALACIDFSPPLTGTQAAAESSDSVRLVECPYFNMERRGFRPGQPEGLAAQGARVWIVLSGQGVVTCDAPGSAATTALARGDVALLPGNMKNAMLRTIANLTLLEVLLPESGGGGS